MKYLKRLFILLNFSLVWFLLLGSSAISAEPSTSPSPALESFLTQYFTYSGGVATLTKSATVTLKSEYDTPYWLIKGESSDFNNQGAVREINLGSNTITVNTEQYGDFIHFNPTSSNQPLKITGNGGGITLKFAGTSSDGNNTRVFRFYNGNATITGNVTIQSSVPYGAPTYGLSLIQVGSTKSPTNASLTVDGGAQILNTAGSQGICISTQSMQGGTTNLIIRDATIISDSQQAIGNQGSGTTDPNVQSGTNNIVIGGNGSNPTIKGGKSAIDSYNPNGTITINSGTIESTAPDSNAVYIEGGEVNVPGNPDIISPGNGFYVNQGYQDGTANADAKSGSNKADINITGSPDVTVGDSPFASGVPSGDTAAGSGDMPQKDYNVSVKGSGTYKSTNGNPSMSNTTDYNVFGGSAESGAFFPPPASENISKNAGVSVSVKQNGEDGSVLAPNVNEADKIIGGLEQNGGSVQVEGYKPVGEEYEGPVPSQGGTVSTVTLGDNFLNYYQLASSNGTYSNLSTGEAVSTNTNNIGLTVLPANALANSLEWEVSSLSGNNTTTPEFPEFEDSTWEWDSNSAGQLLMELVSEDGNWAIQQVITPVNPNSQNTTYTPGNAYLCYNGNDDVNPGLYELTASSPKNSNISDSIRFIVTANTVDDVNIVKPQGQGNPVTFDINQTQSYDFEFETTPADAPANVVEWKLTSSQEKSGFPAGDYAYVNPETGNMTFLQATPPGVYLTLSVSVNGVTCDNPMIIQLTGQWTVEEGIAAYINPVTVQSNQAYNLADNVVATPTYVPIGDTDFLTFDLPDEPAGVILTPAGRLIPQNTNYSGVVLVSATYDDGTTESSTTFNVIFTPRAIAATGVTATPGLEFTTGSQVTQNVMASLLPKGSVQESGGYTPGTTATVTPDIFEYRSTDTSVAVVDSYGNVRAVTEGTAEIITTLKNAEQILTVPSGQQLSDIEEVGTSVTVTGTPAQVPATGITVEPNSPIYLSPVSVNGGTHEQTVTVTVTPENTTDSVSAESGNTSVATVTGEGTSFTVSAVSDGNTTVTFTAGSAKATVQVSVNSEEIISSGLTYSANSPDTFSITAGGVMVNPAIPSLEGTTVDNVTFMAWSGPDQGDMQTFTVNSPGNESFSSGTFTVNGNGRYFYNADNIFVEAYANNSQVYLGSLSPNYDWINTSTAGSSDTVAYITYQENNGFNTPTVFNGGISGVTGKNLQLEGIRVSSNIEGVDVVTDVHLQDLGWVEAVNDGVYAGTQHQARQMEALRLRLVGDNAVNYDIWAQGHVQNTGWMQPVKLGNNIDFIGTTGKALQLEAVKIQIVPKGQTPAGWEAYN